MFNSITEKVYSIMTAWTEEIERANSWFEESTKEEIFKFLNDKKIFVHQVLFYVVTFKRIFQD